MIRFDPTEAAGPVQLLKSQALLHHRRAQHLLVRWDSEVKFEWRINYFFANATLITLIAAFPANHGHFAPIVRTPRGRGIGLLFLLFLVRVCVSLDPSVSVFFSVSLSPPSSPLARLVSHFDLSDTCLVVVPNT